LQPQNNPPVVFITGASSGLGAALARHYGRQGAVLGLCGRRMAALEHIAAGLNAHCYVADVRDAQAMRAAAQAFMHAAGVPDIVIACAGISVGVLTEETEDLPVFQAVMDANVMGLVHTFHPFVAPMKSRGSGVLCGITSVAGVRGLPGGSAYSASKAAAKVYLESLRLELRSTGIAIVTVSPGYIDTPMTEVNPYPMPFKMPAGTAASKITRAIRKRKRHVTIPWQMTIVAVLLQLLPRPIYDRLFDGAPRKPRGLKT
jgi:NAD(P)-dependent dehydrogenase (short-subunit alcohol dehydrogenase family)